MITPPHLVPAVLSAVFSVYIDLPTKEMISMADETPATVHPTISFNMTVGLDKITNALIGALEGGSTYWLGSIEYTHTPNGEYEKPLYSDPTFWSDGGRAKLTYDNPDDTDDIVSKEVGLDEFRGGLIVMAEKNPRHFADLVSENDDAITHDVFIQCVLMGDVVYG